MAINDSKVLVYANAAVIIETTITYISYKVSCLLQNLVVSSVFEKIPQKNIKNT